jgi:hypothetical protein
MALYDVIGKTYAQTRRSDPRITEKLLKILASSPTSTIADIGAGTGSDFLAVYAQWPDGTTGWTVWTGRQGVWLRHSTLCGWQLAYALPSSA